MGAGENDPPDKGERRESETGLERGVGGGTRSRSKVRAFVLLPEQGSADHPPVCPSFLSPFRINVTQTSLSRSLSLLFSPFLLILSPPPLSTFQRPALSFTDSVSPPPPHRSSIGKRSAQSGGDSGFTTRLGAELPPFDARRVDNRLEHVD